MMMTITIKTTSLLWQIFCLCAWLTLINASKKGEDDVTDNISGDCLILTPLIKNGSASTARELAKVKHKEFLGVESYSGFIRVNDAFDSNIFFWYFPASESKSINTPWIIWLQGGPGCSSLFGLFNIHGPFIITDNKVSLRNLTWAEDYSMLYIDNPVGAGFSFTGNEQGYTSNEEEVGEQLLEFVVQFLEVFPELRTRPLFIAGESYAGKYVPALGHQIQKHKHNYEINLKGLIIGNGIIDPLSMLHHGELTRTLGILTDEQSAVVEELEIDAANLVKEGRMVDAANKFNETVEYIKHHSSVNIFNINNDPGLELSFLDFLERPDIRKALHVHNTPFELNNQLVYEKMLPDFMNTTMPWVEELLEDYGILSYRYKKKGGNFTDILIRKAGHMLPQDQPLVAKHMLDDFIEEFS